MSYDPELTEQIQSINEFLCKTLNQVQDRSARVGKNIFDGFPFFFGAKSLHWFYLQYVESKLCSAKERVNLLLDFEDKDLARQILEKRGESFNDFFRRLRIDLAKAFLTVRILSAVAPLFNFALEDTLASIQLKISIYLYGS